MKPDWSADYYILGQDGLLIKVFHTPLCWNHSFSNPWEQSCSTMLRANFLYSFFHYLLKPGIIWVANPADKMGYIPQLFLLEEFLACISKRLPVAWVPTGWLISVITATVRLLTAYLTQPWSEQGDAHLRYSSQRRSSPTVTSRKGCFTGDRTSRN